MAKRLANPFFKIFVSAFLIFFLIKEIGANNIIQQFHTTHTFWLLGGIMIFTVSNLLGSWQWDLILKASNITLPLKKVIAYYFVGLFFNNFLIGYVAGDAFRIYDVTRSSGNNTGAISAVFFDRLMGFVVLTSMAVIASLFWMKTLASMATFITVLVIFAIWMIGLLLLFNQRLARRFKWVFTLLLPQNVNRKLREIYLNINAFHYQKRLLVRITVISIAIQGLRVLTHYAAAKSVGLNNIRMVYFFMFIPVIAVVSSLPISIGGIGVREQAGVRLFSQIGLEPAGIVAMEFLAYLIGIFSTLPGGLIFAFRGKHQLQLQGDKLVGEAINWPRYDC